MLTTTLTVLPIFALIFVGWAVRKLEWFGPQATIELNRFVVYLALPALLFDIVVHAHKTDVWQPGFIAAFGLSCLLLFVISLGIGIYYRRGLADAAINALNAAYPNTGFMGFPLVLAIFGEGALPLALIATIVTVCVIFAIGIALIEGGLQAERNVARLVMKVALSLARNPLILAPIAGAVASMVFEGLPTPANVLLKLLGSAASPCALVALGLFLAEKRPSQRSNLRTPLLLTFAKLILQPAFAVGFAFAVRLPASTTHAALLLAALPTGTGPFMLAELYRCDASITAHTILITTLASIFTVAFLLQLVSGLH